MPDDKALRRKLAEGKNYDAALAELRAEGFSILECIGAVQKFRKCDLVEAKSIVHFSSAWSDVVESLNMESEQLANESERPEASKD